MPETCWDWAAPRWPGSNRRRAAFRSKKRVGGASEKPAGEWNEAEVICKGDRITVYVNGVLQNECSGVNTRGYIALQSEGGPLEFRNIYLTEVE